MAMRRIKLVSRCLLAFLLLLAAWSPVSAAPVHAAPPQHHGEDAAAPDSCGDHRPHSQPARGQPACCTTAGCAAALPAPLSTDGPPAPLTAVATVIVAAPDRFPAGISPPPAFRPPNPSA